jgi:hypothetical protein
MGRCRFSHPRMWVQNHVELSLLINHLDGTARTGATLCGELLNVVFANIGQQAVRKVARETFEHLLNLDLRFHLARQTGGLTRAIDRGTKYVMPSNGCNLWRIMYLRGITFMLQAIIFRIVPTALEISMVCGILVSNSLFECFFLTHHWTRLGNLVGTSLQSLSLP